MGNLLITQPCRHVHGKGIRVQPTSVTCLMRSCLHIAGTLPDSNHFWGSMEYIALAGNNLHGSVPEVQC
eukprot:3347714-Amphidinium_carterae.2